MSVFVAHNSLAKLSTPWALRATATPADLAAGESSPAAKSSTVDTWEGDTSPTPWPATYGGDLSVGLLSAATRTIEPNQLPHKLSIAFLLPGDRTMPVRYSTDRVRDGFRYANRAVRVEQTTELIALGSVSFRSPRTGEAVEGPKHRFPDLPRPETLPTARAAIESRGPIDTPNAAALDEYWAVHRSLDTRHIDSACYGTAVKPRTDNRVWVRFTGTLPEQLELLRTPAGRAALIAYLSDDTILEPALASLGYGWNTPGLFSTTVEQNVWFHQDFDASEWLFFAQRLVSRAGDHVVCQGALFTPAGDLVATVLQEGIVRVRPQPGGGH